MISHNAARQSAVKLISWHLSTAAHEGLPCESDIMFNQTVNFDIHLLRLVTHSPYQAFDWHIDRDIYIKLTKVVTSSIDLKPSGKPEKPDIWKSRRHSRLVHSVRYIFPKRKDDTHKPSVIHVTTDHARHGPCCRPFKKSQNRRAAWRPCEVTFHVILFPLFLPSDPQWNLTCIRHSQTDEHYKRTHTWQYVGSITQKSRREAGRSLASTRLALCKWSKLCNWLDIPKMPTCRMWKKTYNYTHNKSFRYWFDQ